MHLADRDGNETSPLFSIDDKWRHRMVVDYEENKVMFKDLPDQWHTLPTTKKGLLMLPLTKEACERHKMDDIVSNDATLLKTTPPPPEPHQETRKKARKSKKKGICHAFVCKDCTN